MRITKDDVPADLIEGFEIVFEKINEQASVIVTDDCPLFASDRKLIPFALMMVDEFDSAMDEMNLILEEID